MIDSDFSLDKETANELPKLFNSLKQKASELKTEALKFKNRDFLNAAVSGSVLVSMADGIISRRKTEDDALHRKLRSAVRVFRQGIDRCLQNAVTQIEFDMTGEASYEALKMKTTTPRLA